MASAASRFDPLQATAIAFRGSTAGRAWEGRMGLSTASRQSATVNEGQGFVELANARWAIRVGTDPWLDIRDRSSTGCAISRWPTRAIRTSSSSSH